jgi:hypothetical protein
MGRPIDKRYFANTNVGLDGEGVGGEGFASVAVLNTTSNAYSTTTTVTWVASAPQIAGGQAASGTATVNGGGRVTTLNVGNAGSGYTSTSSVTITLSPATTGTAVTYAIGLNVGLRANGLAVYAYIPASGTAGLVSGSGGTQRLLGDIVRQTGCNKYLVATSEGVGRVKLVYDGVANAAGEADLTATDYAGCTYYVMKLNGRKAKLKRYGGGSYEFADESWVKWNITGPVTGDQVTLANA